MHLSTTKQYYCYFIVSSVLDVLCFLVRADPIRNEFKNSAIHRHDEYNVFDPTNCKEVANRILCGYDLNLGEIGGFEWWLLPQLLDWYPRVGCSCVSCADVGTIARAQPESELPVGLGPNGQPPPVGVDGIPIGGSMPGLPVQPTSLRKQCCPYDFDSSLCKYHDDRVLCGYNKNLGVMRSVTRMIPKGDGCRLRGGRIECGYHESPYYGIRRPPARDAALPDLNNLNEQRSGNYPVISTPEAAFDVTAKKELLSNNDGNLWPFGGPGRNVESKEDSSQPQVLRENEVESITEAGQWVTRCVEINNRIVCNRVGKPAEAEE